MKKIIVLMLLASATGFANVYFPTGGDGDTYHVDTYGSPIKRTNNIKKELPVNDWVIETMKPPKHDIVPDGWPTR